MTLNHFRFHESFGFRCRIESNLSIPTHLTFDSVIDPKTPLILILSFSIPRITFDYQSRLSTPTMCFKLCGFRLWTSRHFQLKQLPMKIETSNSQFFTFITNPLSIKIKSKINFWLETTVNLQVEIEIEIAFNW